MATKTKITVEVEGQTVTMSVDGARALLEELKALFSPYPTPTLTRTDNPQLNQPWGVVYGGPKPEYQHGASSGVGSGAAQAWLNTETPNK